MANHKSAFKRIRQSEKARIRNRSHRTRMKTYVKRVLAAIEAKDPEAAQVAMKAAIPLIDRAATKGAIKSQTASRKISRLAKAVSKIPAT